MLYAAWIVASVIFFPLGLLGIAVWAVTGWQPLPPGLMSLSAILMVASVPGLAYMFVERDL